ncbi:hypothetical protein [Desulfosporosinus fructosivorans]|nr:hypothetical protein [Desulfosporosinus fructosivorans]
MILRLKQRDTEGFDLEILQQIGVAVDELVVMRCELARVLRLLPIDQQQVVIDVDLLGVSLLEVAERNQRCRSVWVSIPIFGSKARKPKLMRVRFSSEPLKTNL